MGKIIIFFILVGIFNAISKMLEKKAKQSKYTKKTHKKKKEPYFTAREVSKKVYKPQTSLNIDDLFRSIDEAAEKVSPAKPSFSPMPPPPVKKPLKKESEDKLDILKSALDILEEEDKPTAATSVESEVVSQQNDVSRMVNSKVVKETKRNISLEFSENPLINGIIWSEVLKRPKHG